MAGIGFELRKILREDRLLSLAKVYGYSAILSSGPWAVSIVAIVLLGFLNLISFDPYYENFKSQVVSAYVLILATSLIAIGIIQLPLTRYIADLIYAKKENEVLPTFFGSIVFVWVVSLPFIVPFFNWVFPEQTTMFVLGVISTFLVLCAVWIASMLAASLKYYTEVVWSYFGAYSSIVALSYFFANSLETLIFIFFLGNSFLFIILLSFIVKSYHTSIFLKIEFALAPNFHFPLVVAGFTYNLGAWIDKFIFWYHPLTGYPVIGKLHASMFYDMPIFLAYLSILPGMAIFFYRLEADFAEKYDLYYDAVRSGGTLGQIQGYRKEMINVIRHAVHEVLMVQGIVDTILFLSAPSAFDFLNIPRLYLGLLLILTIGALLQVAFMSVLAILYYLDRKVVAMWLSVAFFVTNTIFTLISINLGSSFFGYGYTVSLLVVFIASLYTLRNEMKRLDYETFMLQ